MTGKKDKGFFATTETGIQDLDPSDPKTWCIARNRNNPEWVKVTAQMHDHAMTLAGVPASRFYYDARTHVHVMVAVAAYYGFDAGRGSYDSYNIEAEALGQKMIYSPGAMPTVDNREPLIKTKEDLAKLRVPDWLNAGRVRFALDVIKMNAGLGLNRGYFCAPFSLAALLRSYSQLIRDMRRDPEFAHDLFSFLVDEVLPSYLALQKEHCGTDVGLGSDAWAAFPNLTPKLLEEWVVPYTQRLNDNLKKQNQSAIFVAGADYCEMRIESFDAGIMGQCLDIQKKFMGGAPVFILGMGAWDQYPLEAVQEYLEPLKKEGTRAVITCGVPAQLLRNGPTSSIQDTIRRMIDAFARDHTVSFWLANIPSDTPPDHIHAAVAAIHQYGRLPIAEHLEDIEVKVPERESLHEFIENVSGGAGLSLE